MTARTPDELRDASRTLLYEAQVLFGVAKELETRAVASEDDRLPWAREMALIEAFALHSRALIEFLWRSRNEERPPRTSDVLAEDFFEDRDSWSRLVPPKEPIIADVARRVGQEIVHITYHRQQLTEDAKQWQFAQVAVSLGRPLGVFVQNVPPHHVAPDFKTLIWHAMPPHLQGGAIAFPPTFWPPAVATRMADPS